MHQRQRLGAAPGRQGRHRVRAVGQRVRRGRGPRGATGDLRSARTRADRRLAAQVAGHPAASVWHRGSRRRLPLRHLDPAGRVLANPDAGQTRLGSGLFRAGHPRQPRHRPPRSGCPDLRPAAEASRATRDARTVSHQGDHPRSHPEPARGLQAHPNQAVPQTREGITDRDHHQRHHRLFDRQTADQSARAAGDRLLRQPAPAARPITQSRPDHRRRGPAHRHRADHHQNRHPHPRAAAGTAAQPRPARGAAAVPAANPTGSPTRICARSPPNYAGSIRPRSPPDRSPTTCAGCACAASSPVSRTPTATDPPNTACTPRCSSPPSTTDSYPPAWPNSPTSSPRHHCARHPAPTAMPSIPLPGTTGLAA